ncbi:winged helix-turn-helix domain-containing protein [Enterobacter asburiae]|nr:winged helix-turn-helix transcriptional regulator [Enterobacter asburiae]
MYILNEVVIFDPDNKTIYLKSEASIVKNIPLTACHLMVYLIKKAGIVVDRSELLENVWDKRGYTSSNASLNNNISVLRKSYTDLTGHELGLETIPKVGFILNAEIRPISPDENIRNESTSNKSLILLYALLTLFSLSSVTFALVSNMNILKEKDLIFLKKIKSCSIYSYDMKGDELNETDFKNLENNCNGNKVDVFLHRDDSFKEFYLYTFCETAGNRYKSCINEKVVKVG